ncbi:MAG: hypothetical protein PHO83_14990 [Geobacteraceae bacterium]|nr:hypothetical protein [Geobacteraceae bacterium]
MKRLVLLLSILFIPCISHAATGDVLFNCTFDGAGSSPSQVVANCGGNGGSMDNSATIVTGGHDGRKAVSYYYPNGGSEVINAFKTPALNKQELTVEYWEKFDVDPKSSGLMNVKSIRSYVGPNSGDYMAAIMSAHNNGAWYQSTWATGSGTLTTTSSVTGVVNSSSYCTGSGTSYTCNSGRLELSWTPGWGTSWHKVRVYMKVPSNSSTADGITKVWIDDKLIYTLSNIKSNSTWYPYTTYILFHPSDDFFQGIAGTKFAFHHLYDDITVYEGYVPPSTSGTTNLAAPIGLRVVSN